MTRIMLIHSVLALSMGFVAAPARGQSDDKKPPAKGEGHKTRLPGCPAKYEKEPAKYSKALDESYTFQTKCPVSGERIDPKISIETKDGHKIYFCCNKCSEKLLKNPEKYLDKLADQGYPIDAKDLKAGEEKETPKPKKSAPNM